jgi:tRNA uridine 5-carbamoylmethylation protein Kti12
LFRTIYDKYTKIQKDTFKYIPINNLSPQNNNKEKNMTTPDLKKLSSQVNKEFADFEKEALAISSNDALKLDLQRHLNKLHREQREDIEERISKVSKQDTGSNEGLRFHSTTYLLCTSIRPIHPGPNRAQTVFF